MTSGLFLNQGFPDIGIWVFGMLGFRVGLVGLDNGIVKAIS